MEKTGAFKTESAAMIVLGIFFILWNIIVMCHVSFVEIFTGEAQVVPAKGVELASFAFLIAGAVLEIITGVMGTAACKNREKAGLVLILSIVTAVSLVVGGVMAIFFAEDFDVFDAMVRWIVPIYYIAEAVKFKRGGPDRAETGSNKPE